MRLTAEQVGLCRALLCQELMTTSRQLGKGIDGGGNKLSKNGLRDLTGYSLTLQLTLMALGMTSDELEGIVKSFGAPSS